MGRTISFLLFPLIALLLVGCTGLIDPGRVLPEPMPNLVVSDYTYEVTDFGSNANFSVLTAVAIVRNDGDADAVGQFTVAMESPADAQYPGGNRATSTAYGQGEAALLRPGEYRRVTVGSYIFPKGTRINVPVTLTADYDPYGDASDRIIESSENDNARRFDVELYVEPLGCAGDQDCPAGMACRDRVCITPARTCTDSDGGINADVRGNVTTEPPTSMYADGPFEIIRDVCDDSFAGANLREYYCDENSNVQSVALNCAGGCSEGACLPGGSILSPGAGETVREQTQYLIRWNAAAVRQPNVSLTLIFPSQYTYQRNIIVNTANDGEYLWSIPMGYAYECQNSGGCFVQLFAGCNDWGTQCAVYQNGSVFSIVQNPQPPLLNITEPVQGAAIDGTGSWRMSWSSVGLEKGEPLRLSLNCHEIGSWDPYPTFRTEMWFPNNGTATLAPLNAGGLQCYGWLSAQHDDAGLYTVGTGTDFSVR